MVLNPKPREETAKIGSFFVLMFLLSIYYKIRNIKDIALNYSTFLKKGEGNFMKLFLSKEPIKIPVFSSKWLSCSFAFLIVGQLLDGLTTKIGLDLGLVEVGKYAMPILDTHGFWGLMAWKYSIIAALGAMYFLVYYVVKKYDPERLNLVTIILTFGCLIGFIASIQVDVSNIFQIQTALQRN